MADTLSSVGTNIKNLMKEPGIVIIVVVSVIILGGMYYYFYIYDPLHRFRVTLLPKPRNMLGKNKKLDLIINPTGVGINPSETEVSYSMWMFLENFVRNPFTFQVQILKNSFELISMFCVNVKNFKR